MPRVKTKYARNGQTHIAYQAIGQGSIDLVLVPGRPSNVDILWEDHGYGRFVQRLSAFARILVFDRRGTGLSDPIDPRDLPDLMTLADDLRAVMDAAGSRRAAILALSDGVASAVAFATRYSERTRALVLYGGCAFRADRHRSDPPKGTEASHSAAGWGTGAMVRSLAPTRLSDPSFVDWWARLERLSASPASALALMILDEAVDLRPLLPAITCPTLVLHRRDDAFVPMLAAARLAAGIRSAELVDLPGRDHPVWIGAIDEVVDQIELFLTGGRTAGPNRVLATLLVTRIRNWERMAAAAGAFGWREILDRLQATADRHAGATGGRRQPSTQGEIRLQFDRPTQAIQCAEALRRDLRILSLHAGFGIHAGEFDLSNDGLAGVSVLVAERIAGAAGPDEILVSGPIVGLILGSGVRSRPAGSLTVDGLDRPIDFCRVEEEQHLEPRVRATAPDVGQLSGRERQVLRYVAKGLSNAAIGLELDLSEHTVKRHVANILAKLDLPTRAAAAGLAARDTEA